MVLFFLFLLYNHQLTLNFSLLFFPSLSDARLFNIAVDTDKKRQLELELQVFVTGNEEKSGEPGNTWYL